MKNFGRDLKLLELYSGIGGMRYALEALEVPYTLVAAIDINTVVNDIYQHNFGKDNHHQRNIESFTCEEFDLLSPDIITLSPPCQPFTRLGLKLDTEDERTKSFLYILDVMNKLKTKPQYFFLENVVGFEKSIACKTLIETLNQCGYVYQEFHLSPLQFGIPNSRMRYYLLAKLKPSNFIFHTDRKIFQDFPSINNVPYHYHCNICKANKTNHCINRHFLENQEAEYLEQYYLSDNDLKKHAYVLDIVEEDGKNTCCFTKAYARYLQGTGSVLHSSSTPKVSYIYEKVSQTNDRTQQIELLKVLKLRFFTPKEVANLMCFPRHFDFPDHVTKKQKYKALGNSVNVFVVSKLIELLLADI